MNAYLAGSTEDQVARLSEALAKGQIGRVDGVRFILSPVITNIAALALMQPTAPSMLNGPRKTDRSTAQWKRERR